MTLALVKKNTFDFSSKRMHIIFAAVALLSFAGIIAGVFAMRGETELVLKSSLGREMPTVHLLENDELDSAVSIIDPNAEVRGVWIATVNNINYPSAKGLGEKELKGEIDSILAVCEKNGLNAVYFQVRPCADALYKSKIFPTSEYLTGKQGSELAGDFDPLEYLVGAAHEKNINVHAWVNPLRVTYGSKSSPAHDTSKLFDTHPAKENPEYTVAYGDGKLYFNIGIPEVRELICDGVREIAEGYDVDGIVFDDYFYPYPTYTNGVKDEFDDSVTYEKYSNGETLEDWRRENVNDLIKSCYETIKSVDSDMLFGVSPFGIWQNDDGENGGSDTNGTEAYSELYCDALAWIKGGYVDYVAPQIYWNFTNSAARYDTLLRWWNAACDSSGVDLLVSHAAYKYGDGFDDDADEISNQIEFARSEMSYCGSILYGYDAIRKNTEGISDELERIFENDIVYTSPISDESGVIFNSPYDGSTLQSIERTYLLASSDPAYPVYYNGQKLSRTKSGYFSIMLELEKNAKNTFTFTQNGEEYIYTLYNGISRAEVSGTQIESERVMSEYTILPVTPTDDLFVRSGESITVTVKAPANSDVTCTLGTETITLEPTKKSPGRNKLYEMTYTGVLTLPSVAAKSITDLGQIKVGAKWGSYSAETEIANVRVGREDAVIPIEVTAVRTGLKIARDSYYYDDFTSQACGMRDNAVRLEGGYYLLRVGGYVAQGDVREIDQTVPIAEITSAGISSDGERTHITIDSSVNIPMNGRVEDGYFILNLYNVDTTDAKTPEMTDNPLFESVEYQISTKSNCFRYHLKLKDPDAFYGFEFSYDDGKTIVSFRNPQGLADGDRPLVGRTIVLDAGHGGSDAGASGGSARYTEAALNLSIVLAARDKLEALGADVVLTRSDDSYVALVDRMNYVEELSPDLMVSVHQNSMEYYTDVTKVRGLMALYWEYAGRGISNVMANVMSESLGRANRGATTQRLAMVRCERYPSTLIEVGFMTNVEEYERTASSEGIDSIAEALTNGILEYYRRQG